MSGRLTLPSQTVQSTSPTIDFYDTDQGSTRYLHVNSNLMGFLKTDGNWDMYMNNGGSMWTANYGWLHDYFFSGINNCAPPLNCNGNTGNCYGGPSGNVVAQNCGNITREVPVLEDGGGALNLRMYRYVHNCNCNCQCDCRC
jgi:hypothetical protein